MAPRGDVQFDLSACIAPQECTQRADAWQEASALFVLDDFWLALLGALQRLLTVVMAFTDWAQQQIGEECDYQ